MTTAALPRRLTAEFLGTFWLVFGGCGSAVLDAAFPKLGIGFAGVALAFGLTVLTGAYQCVLADCINNRRRWRRRPGAGGGGGS